LRRDARIITIYEGTTGIQANDLIGRKVLRERGATLRQLIGDMRATARDLSGTTSLQALGTALGADLDELDKTLDWILDQGGERLADVLAGAVPFLLLLGTVCGSWQMGRAALVARQRLEAGAQPYYRGIAELASYWFTHHAPQAQALARTVREGGPSVTGFALEDFDRD